MVVNYIALGAAERVIVTPCLFRDAVDGHILKFCAFTVGHLWRFLTPLGSPINGLLRSHIVILYLCLQTCAMTEIKTGQNPRLKGTSGLHNSKWGAVCSRGQQS